MSKYTNRRIHALCEDYEGERFLFYCEEQDEEKVISEAELNHGWQDVNILDWLNDAEAEASGLDEW